uniref:Interferon a3-like n=1 Tax=Oncorhynchus mykiss TaxID=8022 RepID=A0A8C7UA87_ONCMY
MYTMQSWTCIFLIICSMQSVCHCCDSIRHHYGHLRLYFMSVLIALVFQGGDITKQNAPVEDKVRFRNEAIYKITKLFDGNMKFVTWNKKNLDDFLKILERQFETLNSLLFHFVRHVSPAMKPERRLKRYFKKLNRKVLRKMNYSAQAWELIRKEMKRHLQILDILVAQLY